MISFISTLFRHRIFCYLGSSVRYLLDLIKKRKNNRSNFKSYRDYKENPENEMLDAIIGFFIFGILVAIIVRLIEINSRR